jgi:hypothetical protein
VATVTTRTRCILHKMFVLSPRLTSTMQILLTGRCHFFRRHSECHIILCVCACACVFEWVASTHIVVDPFFLCYLRLRSDTALLTSIKGQYTRLLIYAL